MNPETPQGDKRTHSSGGTFWCWFLGALALYLIPFMAVMIDERVLKTFWFSQALPKWVGDFMRTIYPFWKLLN